MSESKTPRTDDNTYGGKGIIGAGYVSADFARTLELELAEAKEIPPWWQAEQLAKDIDQLTAQRDTHRQERDSLRAELLKSQAECAGMKEAAYEMAKQYQQEMIMTFGHAKDCDCGRCEPYRKYLAIRSTSGDELLREVEELRKLKASKNT